MQSLVTPRQEWAALRELTEVDELVAAERTVGRAHLRDGTIVHIWRLAGQRAKVGIWRAADAIARRALPKTLPLRRLLDAEVTALAARELAAT